MWLSVCALRAQGGELNLDYLNPRKYTLDSIAVIGTETLDERNIIGLTGLKVGDVIQLPGDVSAGVIRRIWGERLVADVELRIGRSGKSPDGIIFYLYITERNRLSEYSLIGVKKGEQVDMREKLNLRKGAVLSDAAVKNAKHRIEANYRLKGYYNVQVSTLVTPDPVLMDMVQLQITVDKGEKVKIDPFEIDGNRALSDKRIKKAFKDTKERKALRIFKRSKFVRSEFKEGMANMLALYRSDGYIDAKVVSDTVWNRSKKLVGIRLTVDEGQRYYFGSVTWSGNTLHANETLDRILGIEQGDVYNAELLDQRLNYNPSGPDVSSLYLDQGYLFYNAQPIQTRLRGDTIDLEIYIYEGKVAYLDRIIIEGNTKTSDHVVRRELFTIPGEKFSRTDLIRSQQQLAALGYFDAEQMGILPMPNPEDGTVDVKYTLVEKPTDQLQLSGGWGGFVGFVGTLGLQFNNFSLRNIPKLKTWSPLPNGDGQRLGVSFQASGRSFQTYNITFTEPWLGGRKPNALTVSLSRSAIRRFNNPDNRRDVTGRLDITGVTVSLSRRLRWPDDFFTLTNSVSYLNYQVDNYQSTLCTDCIANNFNHTLTLARSDRGINPNFYTRGSRIALSVATTPPYSLIKRSLAEEPEPERFRWVEYHKWNFDSEWYFQVTGHQRSQDVFGDKKSSHPLVLQLRSHLGFIGSYNPSLGVGPFERFVLGGDGLSGFNFLLGSDVIGLRGYQNASLSPVDEGGIVFTKYVSELRFPLVTQGIATIYILTFLEAGNAWNSYTEYNPLNVFRSGGFGVRIFMPAFGQLGIDWGKGFDDVPGCPTCNQGQFHFRIGQQIR